MALRNITRNFVVKSFDIIDDIRLKFSTIQCMSVFFAGCEEIKGGGMNYDSPALCRCCGITAIGEKFYVNDEYGCVPLAWEGGIPLISPDEPCLECKEMNDETMISKLLWTASNYILSPDDRDIALFIFCEKLVEIVKIEMEDATSSLSKRVSGDYNQIFSSLYRCFLSAPVSKDMSSPNNPALHNLMEIIRNAKNDKSKFRDMLYLISLSS